MLSQDTAPVPLPAVKKQLVVYDFDWYVFVLPPSLPPAALVLTRIWLVVVQQVASGPGHGSMGARGTLSTTPRKAQGAQAHRSVHGPVRPAAG